MTPQVRVAARAALVGVTSLLAQLQASTSWDSALIRSGIISAVLAGLEVLTPLNGVVGPGKDAHVAADPTPAPVRKPARRKPRARKKPAA